MESYIYHITNLEQNITVTWKPVFVRRIIPESDSSIILGPMAMYITIFGFMIWRNVYLLASERESGLLVRLMG